ncbi:MAG: glycosyltransferase family 2 protein [Deltaproteobacteria bacterium]|nr:MAG: glycosyltransferase family 2 protein [Deltaproteobacteria bacterium]
MAAVSSLTADVVVPARDAGDAIGAVLAGIPTRACRTVVVVDYGSKDDTAAIAEDAGAVVLHAPRGGYGAACRRGIDHLASLPQPPDAVVFVAADGRDDPADIPKLLAPLAAGDAELAIGVRPGSRGVPAAVALRLIGAIYRQRFDDLGRFCAIRLPAAVALSPSDRGDGFPAELLVKALRFGLRIEQVPVRPGDPRRLAGGERLRRGAAEAGRALFHIVRNATVR